MRVLQIIDSFVSGGKERQLVELLKGLKRESDVDCEIIVQSDVMHYEELEALAIPTRRVFRRSRYDPGVYSRLRKVVRKFGPDIIHSWNTMCSVYSGPIAKLEGAVFVNGFVRDAPPNLDLRDTNFLRGKLTLPFSDVVVANSRAGLASYAIPASRGVVIHNGFDLGRVSRVQDPARMRQSLGIDTEFVVGMVASFSDGKDYQTFFEASRILSRTRKDVTFVAVGEGPNLERYRTRLIAEGREDVKLLGRRSDVESIVNLFTIGTLISNADMHGEGISNALMEYMALAKPVIATECGGNREIVTPGESGFLVGNHDAGAIAARIGELLEAPERRASLGAAGKRRIALDFSLEQMTSAYLALYKGLIARKHGVSAQDAALRRRQA